MKTRDRIILQARLLFNQRGFGDVTTAALAEACGIAEGNLWYHFRTKRDLLQAIAEQFAQQIEQRLTLRPDPADPVGSYCHLLGALMQELRNYRFLYRDQPQYGAHVEPIASNVADWLRSTERSIAAHLAALLDLPAEQLPSLAANATIILRYGLEHFAELGEPEGTVRKTLTQQLTLFRHALEPAAADQISTAIAEIEREVRAAA